LSDELQKSSFFKRRNDTLEGYLVKFTGKSFLNLNQVSRHIYIDSGLMVHYSLQMVLKYPVIFFGRRLDGQPQKFYQVALNGHLGRWKIPDPLRFCRAHRTIVPFFTYWLLFKNHLQQVFFNITQHNADFAMLDAKERYYKFMREKPGLLNRVPQYYVAAYLGIKPQSLSRIRKEG
jgi:hypothetical protein